MQKINLTANNKHLKSEFCELIEMVHNNMVEDHISADMIIPHICGMLTTATWAGILTAEDAKAITLALLIDTCKE